MNTIEEIIKYIQDEASKFGAKFDERKKDYILRKNIGTDALNDNGGYFGFIHPEEEPSGLFSDFSITIFPALEGKPWVLCLGIGLSGFKNDYELAGFPGVRRTFIKLIDEKGFCKSNFLDIESPLPKQFIENVPHLRKSLDQYSKVLPVCQILTEPTNDIEKKIISSFIAAYAKIRNWATNQSHRDAITSALNNRLTINKVEQEEETYKLIKSRKYLILQGPPGTGKTRLAKILAEKLNSKVFFTQFHAETSYSDFIYGIRPNLDASGLKYSEYKGKFYNALEYAILNKDQNVVLIIDELNRANLSNILGPIFYLFEYKMDDGNVELNIGGNLDIKKIPSNFFVIGTMNTADRSLAVVDFALRRRFAWYDLKPEKIDSIHFCEDDFNKFNEFFFWYADSDELNLQPGQGYFLAENEDQMSNRIKYELYPLIREYLAEGLLLKAKEVFNKFFIDRIGKSLYE